MASSFKQFLVAVYLAVGFVIVRLLYSIVFGASGGENTLFSIPRIELSGIFSHITIFGPVSLEMLGANFRLALPFALTILVFGALGLLVKPAKLMTLAKRTKYGSQLISGLAIALLQMPSLASAWQRISKARKLRGEKQLRMLVSLFEVSLAKALAIGLRLELDTPKSKTATLALVGFLPDGARHKPVDLEIRPGDLIVITGATGVGKTGLLEGLAGLTSDYFGRAFSGTIPTKPDVQFLPQSPRELLFGPTVGAELSGCRPLFGLGTKSELSITNLSEGEAVQVSLSRIFSSDSSFYLLDEPFASLDQASAAELVRELELARAAGKAVVIVEHQTSALEKLHPQFLNLTEAGLSAGIWKPSIVAKRAKPLAIGEQVMRFDVPLMRSGKRVLFDNLQLTIRSGEAIALTGPNGSGKTTLLRQLCKTYSVNEVAMVPELVEDFFVCQTLREELERSDKIAQVTAGFTAKTLESFVELSSSLLATHPRDLSAGQKLALACSMQISHKPKVLLIDEPVKGFDPELRVRAIEVLGCVLETSTAIIFATHDSSFAAGLASRQLKIDQGSVSEIGGVG